MDDLTQLPHLAALLSPISYTDELPHPHSNSRGRPQVNPGLNFRGKISEDGGFAWIWTPTVLRCFALSNGSPVSMESYQFGALINCTCEYRGGRGRGDNNALILVGVGGRGGGGGNGNEDGVGALILVNPMKGLIKRIINFDYPVTCVNIIEENNNGGRGNNALLTMVGVGLIGLSSGSVAMVDLALDIEDKEPFNVRWIRAGDGNVLGQLRNDSLANGNVVALRKDSFESSNITALTHFSQGNIIAVGYSNGSFHLIDLLTMETVHRQDSLAGVSVFGFSFTTPVDDPKPYVYLWVVHGLDGVEVGEGCMAQLHQIEFSRRNGNEGYRSLKSAHPKLTIPLTNPHELGPHPSRPIKLWNCKTLTFIIYECSDLTFISVFDLDQWYSSRLPVQVKYHPNSGLCPYYVTVNVEPQDEYGVVPVCDVNITKRSLERFRGFSRITEFPCSWSFDGTVLTQCSTYSFQYFSVQEKLIRKLVSDAGLLADPQDYRTMLEAYGLKPYLPLGFVGELDSLTCARFAIFTTLLDHKRMAVIVWLAGSWMNGSYAASGLDIDLILSWIGIMTKSLKTTAEERYWPKVFSDSHGFEGFLQYSKATWEGLLAIAKTVSKADEVLGLRESLLRTLLTGLDRLVIYSSLLLLLWKRNGLSYNLSSLKDRTRARRSMIVKKMQEYGNYDELDEEPLMIDSLLQSTFNPEFLQSTFQENLYPPSHPHLIFSMIFYNIDELEDIYKIIAYYLMDIGHEECLSILPLTPHDLTEVQILWDFDQGEYERITDFSPKCECYRTALVIATAYGYSDLVCELLSRSCPPNCASVLLKLLPVEEIVDTEAFRTLRNDSKFLIQFFEKSMDQKYLDHFIQNKIKWQPPDVVEELKKFLKSKGDLVASEALLTVYKALGQQGAMLQEQSRILEVYRLTERERLRLELHSRVSEDLMDFVFGKATLKPKKVKTLVIKAREAGQSSDLKTNENQIKPPPIKEPVLSPLKKWKRNNDSVLLHFDEDDQDQERSSMMTPMRLDLRSLLAIPNITLVERENMSGIESGGEEKQLSQRSIMKKADTPRRDSSMLELRFIEEEDDEDFEDEEMASSSSYDRDNPYPFEDSNEVRNDLSLRLSTVIEEEDEQDKSPAVTTPTRKKGGRSASRSPVPIMPTTPRHDFSLNESLYQTPTGDSPGMMRTRSSISRTPERMSELSETEISPLKKSRRTTPSKSPSPSRRSTRKRSRTPERMELVQEENIEETAASVEEEVELPARKKSKTPESTPTGTPRSRTRTPEAVVTPIRQSPRSPMTRARSRTPTTPTPDASSPGRLSGLSSRTITPEPSQTPVVRPPSTTPSPYLRTERSRSRTKTPSPVKTPATPPKSLSPKTKVEAKQPVAVASTSKATDSDRPRKAPKLRSRTVTPEPNVVIDVESATAETRKLPRSRTATPSPVKPAVKLSTPAKVKEAPSSVTAVSESPKKKTRSRSRTETPEPSSVQPVTQDEKETSSPSTAAEVDVSSRPRKTPKSRSKTKTPEPQPVPVPVLNVVEPTTPPRIRTRTRSRTVTPSPIKNPPTLTTPGEARGRSSPPALILEASLNLSALDDSESQGQLAAVRRSPRLSSGSKREKREDSPVLELEASRDLFDEEEDTDKKDLKSEETKAEEEPPTVKEPATKIKRTRSRSASAATTSTSTSATTEPKTKRKSKSKSPARDKLEKANTETPLLQLLPPLPPPPKDPEPEPPQDTLRRSKRLRTQSSASTGSSLSEVSSLSQDTSKLNTSRSRRAVMGYLPNLSTFVEESGSGIDTTVREREVSTFEELSPVLPPKPKPRQRRIRATSEEPTSGSSAMNRSVRSTRSHGHEVVEESSTSSQQPVRRRGRKKKAVDADTATTADSDYTELSAILPEPATTAEEPEEPRTKRRRQASGHPPEEEPNVPSPIVSAAERVKTGRKRGTKKK